jgi:EAL domain-containing protein (putative c-di-GMP-specific phosphodiesterase class I)
MMINSLSSSFSPTLDDALSFGERFAKQNGFIIVVLDHMSDQQNLIAQLTTQLYALLKRNIRITDTITRFAQDSWLICLDDCDNFLLERTQYILRSVLNRRRLQVTSFEGALTAVQGALLPGGTLNQATKFIELEIESAKSALRRVKMRRSSALGSSESQKEAQINYIPLINDAILNNRLFLAFQPVVETDSRKLSHYECLVRVIDEAGQLIPAALFIPQCEKSGLIQLIDQKVQQLAVEELMSNRDLRLAINVSAITASEPLWLNTLKAQITARTDLRGRLMVELTETSVFQDIDESIQFLTQLRDVGCPVSIDDFGAGYMSLTHLKTDLIQTVKIDAQYVKNLKTDPNNLHIIQAITALTKPYGIKCLAEGVEDAETANLLSLENIETLQGYYIGKPSPIRAWIH